ncbi:HAD-like protein [Lojkania enalia]|uniref:Mitochondrial import inner membrane translocase subunit TIM50 n=1 Tax=Lojkania enalia TaxID=147567 RepID=A0A9P4KGZ4_9PLEO|nr:HAD-like protein [Didymosphaeria enalia]
MLCLSSLHFLHRQALSCLPRLLPASLPYVVRTVLSTTASAQDLEPGGAQEITAIMSDQEHNHPSSSHARIPPWRQPSDTERSQSTPPHTSASQQYRWAAPPPAYGPDMYLRPRFYTGNPHWQVFNASLPGFTASAAYPYGVGQPEPQAFGVYRLPYPYHYNQQWYSQQCYAQRYLPPLADAPIPPALSPSRLPHPSRSDPPTDVPTSAPASRAKKTKDPKIMLPAPQPNKAYLAKTAEEPYVIDPPNQVLVILDLNGTLIYRPRARTHPTCMVARPFLKPFLQYLFENFSVMIWSSAKPENVKVLVENVLDEEYRSMLVGTWARNTFGLTAHHYNLNVQVYKNLELVWGKEEVHTMHPLYKHGKRFGQRNTVLIDDTLLKASAQPHNLLQVPEFHGSAEEMKSDVLREVAGYLEVVKMQYDVSSFMRKEPFQANGRWFYDWKDEMAGAGELTQQVSL